MPTWEFTAWVVAFVAWSAVSLVVVGPTLDELTRTALFSWLPDWFLPDYFIQHVADYSRTVVLATWIISLLAQVGGAVAEELYFRGYLLPRMAHFGVWAPLLNTLLFSVYHLDSLWQTPARLLALAPIITVIWWKRNVYLGIAWHLIVNLLGVLMLLPLLLD
jgi:membrane protease YdiL (CAAX protease family)